MTSTRTWSQGGTFIHFDDPNFERPQEPEFQMLLTYDTEARNYSGVMMNGPSRCEITGTWDEKTQTMNFAATLADGNRLAVSHRFIDRNHAEPRGVIKNLAGDVLLELAWNQTRRSDEPLPPEPTVDEVLSSYIEAIGGMEASKKHATRKIEGTMTLPGAPGSNKMTSILKAPNFYHMRIEIPGFGVTSAGCDGKIAWTNDPHEGTVQLEGENLKRSLVPVSHIFRVDIGTKKAARDSGD